MTLFAPATCAWPAPGRISRSRRAHVRSVAITALPLVTPDATTQSPATRPGARPPAIPKLMIPDAPRAIAAPSAARNPELWLQITETPGPRAIPASSARQVTATTPACSDIHTPSPGAFIPKAAVTVNVRTCGKTKQQAGILQMFGDDWRRGASGQSVVLRMTHLNQKDTIVGSGGLGDVNERSNRPPLRRSGTAALRAAHAL